jgi:DNA-binding transcriptional ArsR family regulator
MPSGFPPDLRLIRPSGAASVTSAPPDQEAATYAEWFANLAEPTQVQLPHSVATTPGGITISQLTQLPSISQSTRSHHIRKLADIGFLKLHKEGTSTRVMINPARRVGLPHTSDAAKPDTEDPTRSHELNLLDFALTHARAAPSHHQLNIRSCRDGAYRSAKAWAHARSHDHDEY